MKRSVFLYLLFLIALLCTGIGSAVVAPGFSSNCDPTFDVTDIGGDNYDWPLLYTKYWFNAPETVLDVTFKIMYVDSVNHMFHEIGGETSQKVSNGTTTFGWFLTKFDETVDPKDGIRVRVLDSNESGGTPGTNDYWEMIPNFESGPHSPIYKYPVVQQQLHLPPYHKFVVIELDENGNVITPSSPFMSRAFTNSYGETVFENMYNPDSEGNFNFESLQYMNITATKKWIGGSSANRPDVWFKLYGRNGPGEPFS